MMPAEDTTCLVFPPPWSFLFLSDTGKDSSSLVSLEMSGVVFHVDKHVFGRATVLLRARARPVCHRQVRGISAS